MTTVQDAFHHFYASFKQKHSLSPQQAKASWDIMNCSTAALGGNASLCEECGHLAIHYNSCRNRHCPLCQGIKKDIWVDKRSKDILQAPYFHTVFTMPKELHSLIYQNQELLYSLMYKAVALTLQELSQDDKYLGAQIGFFSLLHTWSQELHYHPHIHTVVLAGRLLPKGFVKIRHYGLLANRNKKTKLELSRKLTDSPTYKAIFEGLNADKILSIIIGRDINLCLSCGKGHLKPTYSLFIGASP